jgi:hypothetical protein
MAQKGKWLAITEWLAAPFRVVFPATGIVRTRESALTPSGKTHENRGVNDWERRLKLVRRGGSRRPKVVRLKVKARLGARLLLRRVGGVRVHFARNRFARFGCLSRVEFFIGSATAKGNNSTSEEAKTPVLHGEINNRSPLDFQQR